jgi:hypothetical protein
MKTNNLDYLKNRTLILTQTDPASDMIFNSWISNGLNADIIFKDVSKTFRLIRRVWMFVPLPFFNVWFGKWKDKLSDFDTVILHASELTENIPRYIHKVKPSVRIIYWYWNPVNKLSLPCNVRDSKVEFWSFDQKDCQKYGMRKNIQYYVEEPIQNSRISYDVYFVGHNKGRKKEISDFFYRIKSLNISYKNDLIRNNDPIIPYSEVCRRILKSRSILEINQQGQEGLTLRAMESLFFEKKLITNNKSIRCLPFYDPRNIFILGIDDFSGLRDFIKSDYNKRVSVYKSMYDIDAWFANFFVRRDKC